MTQHLEVVKSYPYKKRPYFEELGASSSPSLPSIQQAPTLELKPLPSHLRYAYLGDSSTLPVIISNSLNEVEEEKLLEVLKMHKMAIG